MVLAFESGMYLDVDRGFLDVFEKCTVRILGIFALN